MRAATNRASVDSCGFLVKKAAKVPVLDFLCEMQECGAAVSIGKDDSGSL